MLIIALGILFIIYGVYTLKDRNISYAHKFVMPFRGKTAIIFGFILFLLGITFSLYIMNQVVKVK